MYDVAVAAVVAVWWTIPWFVYIYIYIAWVDLVYFGLSLLVFIIAFILVCCCNALCLL